VIGVEFIRPVAKDLRNPKRNVLLSMVIALGVLLVVQSILGIGMTNYVPLSELQSSDMPHVVFGEALLGKGGSVWMAIVAVLASVSTTNTVLPATGKILQGMADEKMAPSIFSRTNKRNVPYFGMLLIVVIVFVMILSGYVESNGLINMLLAGSCFWLASYVLTHLNVLVLRRRYPNAERNNKLKLAGIPQIIGMIGCIYMIWNISPEWDAKMTIFKVFFIMFAVLGIYAFIWVAVVRKTKPFKPEPLSAVTKTIDS
ncbi:MAG: APC family permease, partial [Oscillospiraceae bacterium]|nr:APC family permease [Oscillospiraceae bacterium]